MTILTKNDFYKCVDLALATAISLYFPLEAVNHQPNSRRAYFLFKREEGLNELIEQYWRGELKVDPKIYFQQLRIIKARLYDDG